MNLVELYKPIQQKKEFENQIYKSAIGFGRYSTELAASFVRAAVPYMNITIDSRNLDMIADMHGFYRYPNESDEELRDRVVESLTGNSPRRTVRIENVEQTRNPMTRSFIFRIRISDGQSFGMEIADDMIRYGGPEEIRRAFENLLYSHYGRDTILNLDMLSEFFQGR